MNNIETVQGDESARMQVRYVTDPVPRILVVEDSLGIRQTLAEVLTRSGYHVDEAEDAAAGWQALQSNRYDLVITDNNMPQVSGGELVRRMRIAGITLPVIMTSERISAEN